MRGVLFGGMVAMLAVGQVAAVHARDDGFADSVAETMDGLEWGMSHKDVFKLIESRVKERYREQLEEAPGSIEQDQIMSRMREEIAKVRRDFVVFDGRVSGWDVSSVGPEFRRNTNEAMIVWDDEKSRNHYFFIKGRLWKWYRQFKPDAFGGADFDVVGQALMARFGHAEEQQGQREKDGGLERWLAWEGKRSRVTAIDQGSHVVLLLTDLRVFNQLATLRKGALPRRHKRKSTIDSILMNEDEREAWRDTR